MKKLINLLKLNKKKYLGISIIIIYFIFIVTIKLNYSVNVSNAPDETGQSMFVNNIAEHGHLAVDSNKENNIKYKDVFTPRGTVVNSQGESVPLKAINSIYLYGVNYTFFKNIIDSSKFIILIDILTLLIFILYAYKFVLSFNNNNHGLVFFTLLILISLSQIDILVNSYNLFIFISMYYLKLWFDANKKKFDKNLFLSSFFFSIIILLRNELVILYVPIGLLFIYLLIFKKFHFSILLFFFPALIALLTILITNKTFYGDYFSFGYSLDSKSREAFTNESSKPNYFSKIGSLFMLYGFHPMVILKNVYFYLIIVFYMLLIPAILNYRDFVKNKYFTILVIMLSTYIVIYYGSNAYFFGNESATINSSYVRYFSPVYLFLLIFATPVYIKILKSISFSKFKIMLIFTLAFSLLIIEVHSSSFRTYNSQLGYLYVLNTAKERIPKDAVLFSNYWDKLFYQDFIVASMSKKNKDYIDFLDTMVQFYTDNPQKHVYYVPQDLKDQKKFESYISKNKAVKCLKNELLSMCKLTMK